MKQKLKHELQASRETLQRLWEDGLSGLKLLEEHTKATDSFLADRFGCVPEANKGITLIALGGYGRGELFPYSDIDLLFLHGRWIKANVLENIIEKVLYPLWDAGLEVGHSVRTISQCITDCKHDFHLQVAMLDARRIVGSEKLFNELSSKYEKKIIDGRRKEFLSKIQAEKDIRFRQFGDHSFQLEPNIKDGRGGFRDIQSILWTAKVIYGFKKLSNIEESGIFRPDECKSLEDSYNSLVLIRNRLHYLSGRKNDQLFIEHQEEIATALGYGKTSGRLGVEIFMQEVYAHLQNIALTTDIFFEHIHETIVKERNNREGANLESGLYVIHGRIHLKDQTHLKIKPLLLLKIFLHQARTGLPIHYKTRQIVSQSLDLVDDRFRTSSRAAALFQDILNSAADPLPTLSAMLETGFLPTYIPEFENLKSLAQHDVFHIFTVDRHLLQTVKEIKILSEEQRQVFSELEKPQILFLAAILHDIGKGGGIDHSKVGTEKVKAIGKRFSLSEEDQTDLEFLILNHLYMSHIGQRRDLEDEEVIFACAKKIGERKRLNMLYLLSIADARATGPKAWNDWKGALLQELYLRVGHVLDQSEIVDPDLEQASKWMRDQVAEIIRDISPEALAVLPDDYLLAYTPQEVVEHINLRLNLENGDVIVIPKDHSDHWSILIVSCDKTGFLSKICGVFALHNLNVMSAKINTWHDGTVVDVIDVKPVYRNIFREQEWKSLERDIKLAVDNRLGLTHRLAEKKGVREPEIGIKHRQYETEVKIDNEASSNYTVIEIFAEDRPSLLHSITRCMADFNLNISRAIISSRQGQTIDVFYVLDSNGFKLDGTSYLEELRQDLLYSAG